MRKILKDTCIFAALMVLVIFSYSITVVGLTDEIKLVFEIFGLAFVLAVFNYLFDEKTSFSIIAGYLIKYVVVSVVVIAFGFIAGWFYPSNYWMAFIYVGVITVIVFALDSVKTENDVEDINEMVKLSKNEAVEVKPLKKMYGFELWLARILGMVRMNNEIYEMTHKGAFYYHYYENFYTLAYIDKMWGIMRKEAFPERIEL